MPILDIAARNTMLALAVKPSTVTAPTSFDVELWDGDPLLDDTAEITGGGYASVNILPAAWETPAGGQVPALVTFPAPTGAWITATHWVTRDPVTGYGWFYGVLAQPLYVTGAGDPPTVQIVPHYNETGE